jgi:hypothetical protein
LGKSQRDQGGSCLHWSFAGKPPFLCNMGISLDEAISPRVG